MIVMKFGGTSVGGKQAIERTIGIVRGRLSQRPVVVVSAMSKVTDFLYTVYDAIDSSDSSLLEERLRELRARHLSVVNELISDPLWREEAASRVEALVASITMSSSMASVISKGEYLSSNIIVCAMNSLGIRAAWLDARSYMVTDEDALKGEPDFDEICRRAPKEIDAAFSGQDVVVTQGFVGISKNGTETVLGRGGSDFSASITGMAVDADVIEIWTDVDGVRSADPRKVPATRCIPKISFEEASEMAQFGAKVLHPRTIEPAVRKNIPVVVLNSMNPEGEGTTILQGKYIEDGPKSVSSKEKIAVVTVSGEAMENPSALLSSLLSVLSEKRVSVDVVAVKEDCIIFTTDSLDRIQGACKLISEFAEVSVSEDYAQISVIGKNVPQLKTALRGASAHVAVSPIMYLSRTPSFVNISFVVPKAAACEVINDIHKYIFE